MSFYAVVETGGKQYRVQAGDIFQVEKLEGEVGSSVKFDHVLFASKMSEDNSQVWIGKPTLSGASVQAEIVGQGRGEKILIIKMKRRKQYRRTQGHRQFYTQLIVTGVDNGAGEKATLDASAKKEKLTKFQSHLAPKGEAFTPKTLGSRKRMKAAGTQAAAPAEKTAAPKAAKAPKAAAAPKAKKTTKKSAE
jgi:large subunit ribosomal protein L21